MSFLNSTIEGFNKGDLDKLTNYNSHLQQVSDRQSDRIKYSHDNPGGKFYHEKGVFSPYVEEVLLNDLHERMDYHHELQFAAVITGISAIILSVMIMSK